MFKNFVCHFTNFFVTCLKKGMVNILFQSRSLTRNLLPDKPEWAGS